MAGSGYMKAYHCILDEAIKYLKGGSFQVFYYIYRKTIGWNTFEAKITMREYQREIALSGQGIANILEKLDDRGWIHIVRKETKGGRPYHCYSLGTQMICCRHCPRKLDNVKVAYCPIKLDNIVQESRPILSKKVGVSLINKDNNKDTNKTFLKGKDYENQSAKKPDLLSKLEFLPGIINLTKEEDKRYFEYIQEYNETQVDTVLDEAKRRTKLPSSDKERLQRKSVLKFIAGGLENYDVFYNKADSRTDDKKDPIEPIGRLRAFLDSPVAGDYSPAVIAQRLEDRLPLFETNRDDIAQRFSLSIDDWRELIGKYRDMANMKEVY